MCLAVPGKVVKRDDGLKATVDMMGIELPAAVATTTAAAAAVYPPSSCGEIVPV